MPLVSIVDHSSFLPPILETITSENAHRLELLAYHGRGTVNDLEWAPDGKSLGLATSLGIYLYGSESLEVIWFRETESGQASIDFHSDGLRMATGGEDGLVSIWDASTGALVRSISGHVGAVTHTIYSPDGQRLMSLEEEEVVIEVWNAQTGEKVRSLQGGELESGIVARRGITIHDIDVSPNGRWVAAVTDRSLRLWELDTGALRAIVPMPRAAISVAFSPSGERMATTHDNNTVWVRDAGTGQPLRSIVPDASVTTVGFSPEGSIMATWGGDSLIGLWDLVERGEPEILNVGLDPFSPWGSANRPEFIGSDDEWRMALPVAGTAVLWRSGDAQPYGTLGTHIGEVRELRVYPSKNAVMSLGAGATLWDNQSGSIRPLFEEQIVPIGPYGVGRSGRLLARWMAEGRIQIWDVEQERLLSTTIEAFERPSMMVFDPAEKYLAGLSGNHIWVSELSTGESLHEVRGLPGWTSSLFFGPEGAVLGASGSTSWAPDWESLTMLWDVETGTLLNTVLEEKPWGWSNSWRDGTLIETSNGLIVQTYSEWTPKGALVGTRVLEGSNWRTLHTLEGHNPTLSFGGSLIATSDDGGTVWIWSVDDGGLLREISAHDVSADRFPLTAFNVDGTILASTGGNEPSLMLWDVNTGSSVFSADHVRSETTSIEFSSEGKLLVTGHLDGVVRIWGIVPWSESD